MSKRYNIRWKQDDVTELNKAVKNFNAKIRRLEQKNPDIKNALPEKISVGQIKNLIDSRQDLNRELNALRRFTKRGSEQLVDVPENDYNLKITKWQKDEMTRRTGVINRRRNKRLKEMQEIEMTSRGEKLGYSKGQVGMGKADELSLTPLNSFTPKMSRTELKKKFKTILNESRSGYWHGKEIMMKQNFIKALQENFNPNDITDVVETIENMDFKQFRNKISGENDNFESAYPPNAEQYAEYLSSLKATWMPKK